MRHMLDLVRMYGFLSNYEETLFLGSSSTTTSYGGLSVLWGFYHPPSLTLLFL
jgi:hypothetical protein